ncbi:MAG: hypothetical protein KGS61_13580, partial [Verrucomicrobia bacterium]|nr:hypothetical protein [Verrucomicrobiota bacterium]
PPYATNGGYQLFTAVVGTNYNVLGHVGPNLVTGSYHYTKTGTNTAEVNLADAQAGASISLQLEFKTATTGHYILTGATGGSQSGTFVLAPRLPVNVPELFFQSDTNSPFQLYLSGQRGMIYAAESSANLNDWAAVGKLAIANQTTNITDTNPPTVQRFYRAQVDSTAFAPDSIADQTLNFTITSGGGLWPTNGTYQWIASATNDSYQITDCAGATNGSGNWTYTRTGAESATVVGVDSQTGVQTSWQLLFTSADTGFYHATNTGDASGFQAGRFERDDGEVEFLGNVGFTADTPRGASVFFPADGTSASLSVTNTDGSIWLLNLPGDALADPVTITMTPFASIDSSAAAVPLTSGVLLEPDGLQFSDAATLTLITPGGLGAHGSLLVAEQDGSDLYFVQSTNQVNTCSTILWHFTSAAASSPSDAQWAAYVRKHLPKAEKAYAKAKQTILAMEAATVIPPPPPDYSWSCRPTNSAAGGKIDTYIKQVFKPESDAIKKLMSAAAQLALMTNDPAPEPQELAQALIETDEYSQVDNLFQRYYWSASGGAISFNTNNITNPNKFMGVYRLASSVNKADVHYGGAGRPDWKSNSKSWAKYVRNFDLNVLKEQHDYKMFDACQNVEAFMEQAFNTAPDSGFTTKLLKAMTFDLTVDINLTAPSLQMEAEGDLTLTADMSYTLRGSGTINYLSGTLSSAILLPGQSFTQNVVVTNLDACDSMTAGFVLDRLGADQENWEVAGADFTGNFLKILGGGPFIGNGNVVLPPSPYVGQIGLPATLNNRQAQAVNQTFEAEMDGADAQVTLTLLHTPQ